MQVYTPEIEVFVFMCRDTESQDPWSVVAERIKKCEEEKEPCSLAEESKQKQQQETTGKRKRERSESDTGGSMNHWSLLPKREAKWMRELLEIQGESFLTVLPCIRDEKIMPSEVFHIINSGRGKIIFYANVVHVTLCPRHLVNGNTIHRHHNDSVVAICITEKMMGVKEEVNRLFVRCFSEKCLHLRRQLPDSKIPSNWEEYKECHHTRYIRLVLAEKKRRQKTGAEESDAHATEDT